MRVLHLITNPCLTHGGPVFEFEVSKFLKKDGIFFDYLITVPASQGDEKRFREQGSELYLLPWDQKHGLLVRELKVCWAYYSFFRKHKYDIVYADTENPMRAIHLLMARLAGVKVRVIHSHNTGMQTTSRLSYKIAAVVKKLFPISATHYFACSDLAAQWLFPESICQEKKYTVLKNGVDLNRFRFDPEARDRIRKKLNLEGKFVVGCIGRFMPQKNHKFLIEVLHELQRMDDTACMLLIGDGPLREEIELQARNLGLQDRICFAGTVENVAEYLSAMDVFCLASIFEGLGIVNIEAQATGLYCLMSDAIPADAKVSSRGVFMSLKAGPNAWAQRLYELKNEIHNLDRSNVHEEIRCAGFAIDDTVNALRNFYLKHNGDATI